MRMTKGELLAFNAGVQAVLNLAHVTGLAMHCKTIERPTRYNFAAEALSALAEEGRVLLKPIDGSSEQDELASQPKSPKGLSGAAAKAQQAFVARIPAGEDGNFGLTDDEIVRPSRETIINWLSGRTPMLASHWSRIAAKLIENETVLVAAE
jgi:hypothetical protein